MSRAAFKEVTRHLQEGRLQITKLQRSAPSAVEFRAQQAAERARLRMIVDWGHQIGHTALSRETPHDLEIAPPQLPKSRWQINSYAPTSPSLTGWNIVSPTSFAPAGVLLTPCGELTIFKASAKDVATGKVQDRYDVNYDDGMMGHRTMVLDDSSYPLPAVVDSLWVLANMGVELGKGLGAIEVGLAQFVIDHSLDPPT